MATLCLSCELLDIKERFAIAVLIITIIISLLFYFFNTSGQAKGNVVAIGINSSGINQ